MLTGIQAGECEISYQQNRGESMSNISSFDSQDCYNKEPDKGNIIKSAGKKFQYKEIQSDGE